MQIGSQEIGRNFVVFLNKLREWEMLQLQLISLPELTSMILVESERGGLRLLWQL